MNGLSKVAIFKNMAESTKTDPLKPGEPADIADPVHQLPAIMVRNERTVRARFWPKLLKVAGRIPFAEEAASAYFCALDRRTPARVRATLLASLAYFILPADLIPDIIAAIGFSDDATVLMAALSIVSSHVKPHHQKEARKALGKTDPQNDDRSQGTGV